MPGDVPFIFRCIECNDKIYIYESGLPVNEKELLCYECNDNKMKKEREDEIEYAYRKYVHNTTKKLKRDY